MFFIQIGGGLGTNPELLTVHFGLLGALIGSLVKKRAKKKIAAALQRLDQADPEQLLHEHKNNFKLYVPEIREAVVEPPTSWALHGKQAGRWNLSVRDGKKMKFEFETAGEMKTALNLLQQSLNSTLKVNVEWDEIKKRFQKRKYQS